MKSRLITIGLVTLVLAFWPLTAQAQWQCTLTLHADLTGGMPVDALICPRGDGTPFTHTWFYQNPPAPPPNTPPIEITATVADSGGYPIAGFPFEDIWLEFGTLCSCSVGAIFLAEANTDEFGETYFLMPAWVTGGCFVEPTVTLSLSGGACATAATVGIRFRGVDFNCDGIVDNLDVTAMAKARTEKSLCADLDLNGKIETSDASVMSQHLNLNNPPHKCPP